MDLHARAVELVLEDGGAERLERVVDVLRRAREHRRERLVERQPKALEPGATFRQRGARDRCQAARQHAGPAHVGGRNVGRRRDRIRHDALERALAQLAEQSRREIAAQRRDAEPAPTESRAGVELARHRRS